MSETFTYTTESWNREHALTAADTAAREWFGPDVELSRTVTATCDSECSSYYTIRVEYTIKAHTELLGTPVREPRTPEYQYEVIR